MQFFNTLRKKISHFFLKKVLFRRFMSKKTEEKDLYRSIPNIINADHNCALITLHLLFPKIPENKIIDAFYHCCKKWPNDGVTNKEFNIVLKFLKLNQKVRYHNKETIVRLLLARKNKAFISLVHGHFLVISFGCILEFFSSYWTQYKEAKVYCYWEKL